jgi:hypothetical protein
MDYISIILQGFQPFLLKPHIIHLFASSDRRKTAQSCCIMFHHVHHVPSSYEHNDLYKLNIIRLTERSTLFTIYELNSYFSFTRYKLYYITKTKIYFDHQILDVTDETRLFL